MEFQAFVPAERRTARVATARDSLGPVTLRRSLARYQTPSAVAGHGQTICAVGLFAIVAELTVLAFPRALVPGSSVSEALPSAVLAGMITWAAET